MGKKTQKALGAIKEAIQEQAEELAKHDQRLDKLESLVKSQAAEINALESQMVTIRNLAIRSAIDRGVPTKVVAQAHGLTPGRISQIAPRVRIH